MEKVKFFNEVREKVTEYYADTAVVSLHEVYKNNVILTGLCVTKDGSNCGPTVYLDDYYCMLDDGKSLGDIVKSILDMIENHIVSDECDVSFYSDYEQVKDRICFKLVAGSNNEHLLEESPHRPFIDMEIIYYVPLDFLEVNGSIRIKNEHMAMWNVDEEELYERALVNTPKIYPSYSQDLFEMVNEMMGVAGGPAHMGRIDRPGDLKIIVATNTEKINGAACMLYPGFLDKIGEEIGGNFYILPSSVHEVIFVNENETNENDNDFENMVRSVNSQCLRAEDLLSNSVYYYDFKGENNVKKVEYDKGAMVL